MITEKMGTLSPSAQELIQKACTGIDPSSLVDYHLHIAGTQVHKTGNFINPNFLSWNHPILRLFAIHLVKAFGIRDINKADQEVIEHLTQLIEEGIPQGKYCLFAFDKYYDEKGCFNPDKTNFYVSNEFVFKAAQTRPHQFVPVMSVHPYREDAIEELIKWAEKGIKLVKWLPNSMGINPKDPRCLPFYQKMKELDLVLISHAGHEIALPLGKDETLGNPLLLRAGLDCGVKIIVAHCATLGKNKDLDHPSQSMTKNYELFLRLVQVKDYQPLLFGDLAAITQVNRLSYLGSLIEEAQPGGKLENRLINGSDYPLPGINITISTKLLWLQGFLTFEEHRILNNIFKFNPLLFDFVLKRTIRHPQTKQSFPNQAFKMHDAIPIKCT